VDAFAELFPGYPIKNLAQPSLKAVVHVLNKLNTCSPEDKKRLLHAVVYCVLSDGVVNPEEVETMRLIAMMLECPMPVLSLPAEHAVKKRRVI